MLETIKLWMKTKTKKLEVQADFDSLVNKVERLMSGKAGQLVESDLGEYLVRAMQMTKMTYYLDIYHRTTQGSDGYVGRVWYDLGVKNLSYNYWTMTRADKQMDMICTDRPFSADQLRCALVFICPDLK